jgi:hypothetical protein
MFCPIPLFGQSFLQKTVSVATLKQGVDKSTSEKSQHKKDKEISHVKAMPILWSFKSVGKQVLPELRHTIPRTGHQPVLQQLQHQDFAKRQKVPSLRPRAIGGTYEEKIRNINPPARQRDCMSLLRQTHCRLDGQVLRPVP